MVGEMQEQIVQKLLRALQKDLKSVARALNSAGGQLDLTEPEGRAIRSVSRKLDRLSLDILMTEDLLEQGRTEELI
jgi:hypothetical protein